MGHLTTPGFNTQLPKVSTGISHRHQTSCSEMRTQETMPLRNVCDKRLYPHNHHAFLSQNIYRHFKQTWYVYVIMLAS